MATYQGIKATSGTDQMPGIGDGQSQKEMASTVTFATAPTAGDTVLSGMIQAGSVITGVRVMNTTGATVNAGPTGALAYHISGGAGTVQTTNVPNVPYVMPANGNIVVTLASGTLTAGFLTVYVTFLPRNA